MKETNFCNTTLLKVKGSDYAFDFVKYEMMKLNDKDRIVFESLINEKRLPLPTDLSMKQSIMKIMLQIKNGFFFTEKPVQLTKGDIIEDYIVSFPIAHSCNLRCKYCFADGGRIYHGKDRLINKNIISKIVQFILSYSDSKAKKIRLEFVSGGETLLSKEDYLDNVSFMMEEALEKGFELEIFTLTNGTLLTEELVEFINTKGIKLGISIDGPSTIHNYHRPFDNGQESYDKIRSNIQNTIIAKNREHNMWIVSVITSHTRSLIDILNHNKELGIGTAEMRIVRGKDIYGLAMSNENIEHFLGLYSEFSDYLKEHLQDLKMILNRYDSFGKIIARLIMNQKVIYRCEAGRTKFSFTADGDIYPCDSFVGIDEYKIGNLNETNYNQGILTNFQEGYVQNIDRCSQCSFRYLCGGDCYYNQFKNMDTIDKDVFCQFQSHLCELAIDLVYYIKTFHMDKFHDLQRFVRIRELQ